jgi:amidase
MDHRSSRLTAWLDRRSSRAQILGPPYKRPVLYLAGGTRARPVRRVILLRQIPDLEIPLTSSLPAVPFSFRRALVAAVLVLALALGLGVTHADAAPALDLDTLSGSQAEHMLVTGEITSVELTEAYLERIDALNKAGPGLNAVTQINREAIAEAEKADAERAMGEDLGPAMGLPILVKDIVDVKGMYTSAGDWALRASYPEKDSGVAKELRAHGLVILGKAGLSEWANSFGSQPSGFSNLTGQVLNANDNAQGPSGSSSGSGASSDAALAALTIGTETSGSIISPATAQSDVGLRPTLGLVPGYGIAPIDASQDTAGPIVRTVPDAAMTLQSIAEVTGTDQEANEEYEAIMGQEFLHNGDIQPAPFTELPDYMSALTTSYVNGKRIGYNGNECTIVPPAISCTPSANQEAVQKAKVALEAAGAILVSDPAPKSEEIPAIPSLPSGYEAHATIDDYYRHLGASVPVHNLVEEVAADDTNQQAGEKDGISAHRSESEAEITPGGKNAKAYEELLPVRKAVFHATIEKMMNEPKGGGGPVIAVIGSVPSGPQAGDPEIAVPMGYSTTQRRNIAVDVNGGPYSEVDLLGVSYVIEQAIEGREAPAEVNPSAYRCAHTATPEPFAGRGHCNPDHQSLMTMLGGTPKVLPFSLESTSAAQLEKLMGEGKLTAKELVDAELYRAALTNSDGPSVQAIRAIAPGAIQAAVASDELRATDKAASITPPPLLGIPVLVDDSIDVEGLATSAGSIALEDNLPEQSAVLVENLEAKGAIILGDTNTTELGGVMEATNMPKGYSSLGGQALLPADTNKSPSGSSAGSPAAVSIGLAPLAVGLEASPEAGQMIVPTENAGLVGLKPTVGLVSAEGVLPVAESQDAVGPIAQTVTDAALELEALTGTAGYTTGLKTTALEGKKVAVVPIKKTAERGVTEQVYVTAENAASTLEATTVKVTPGTPATVASVIPYEFHKGIDAYLGAAPDPGAGTLAEVIAYNSANPVEGLKFGQAGLTAAAAVNTTDPATKTAYEEHLTEGRTVNRAVINEMLTTSGAAVIMVPSGSSLVGVADRAGYPVLTIPAGFGLQNSSTGGDPIGVDLIGTAGSEAALLEAGYALEQNIAARKTGPAYMKVGNPKISGVPSETNQSMFRCTVGSEFYSPYDCNPGEPGQSSVAIADAVHPPVEEVTTTPPPVQTAPESTPTPAPESSPTPTPPPVVKLKPGKVKQLTGKGAAELTFSVSGPGKITLTGIGIKTDLVKVKKAGPVSLMVVAKGKSLKTLKASGKVKVKVTITFVPTTGPKVTETRVLTLVKK